MRRRGISLLEMIMATVLLLLVVGLGVLQTRRFNSKADAKALALLVAGEIRSARAKATQQGIPTAVVFPSAGGYKPHSSSIYNLEGNRRARNTRYANFAGDTAAFVAVATWPASQSWALATYPPGQTFNLDGWPRNPTNDYILCFLPNGRVVTNDWPTLDGQYRLVVAGGLTYTTGSVPTGTTTVSNPPGYFELTGVTAPVTLSITPSGGITISDGLFDLSDPAVLTQSGDTPPAAPPVPPSSVPNENPVVEDVSVVPPPAEDLSDGFDAVLPLTREGLPVWLQLRIQATDPDGDPLTYNWTSTPLVGTEPGTFTQPDTGSQDWVWFPPPFAEPADKFELSCVITDEFGGSATVTGSATIRVEIRDNGIIMYQKKNVGGSLSLHLVYGDGAPTRLVRLPYTNAVVTQPRFSPNGRQVLCTARGGGSGRDLWATQPNGYGAQEIAVGEGSQYGGCWNEKGTQVVYTEIPAPPSTPSPSPSPSGSPSPTPTPTVEPLPEEPLLMRLGLSAQGDISKAEFLDSVTGTWKAREDYDPGIDVPVRGEDPALTTGDLLVFRGLDGELYLYDPAVTTLPNPSVLTGATGGSCPRWVPGVTPARFVFILDGQVQSFATDTGTIEVLTSGNTKHEVAVGPSGTQIVFSEEVSTGQLSLFRANLPASGPIIDPPSSLNVGPVPLSDGLSPDWGL